MTKTTRILLLMCLVLVACAMMFTACDNESSAQAPNDTSESTPSEITEEIPMGTSEDHVHNFSEWHTVKESSCSELGEKIRICACGKTETEKTSMLAHTEVIDNAVSATCTSDGYTEGKHCSVCNQVFVVQEVIPATGHVIVTSNEAVEPTCTTDGCTQGTYCSVCNEVLTTMEVLPAVGHTEETVEGTAPTCTSVGLTDGKQCSICQEVLVIQEEIPPKHNDEYGVCTDCNQVTDGALAAQHYFNVDVSTAYGKVCTCYMWGDIYAQYYVEGIYYDVSVTNTYDGRIAAYISFEVDYDVLRSSEYFEHTAYLNYVIMDGNYTAKSGTLEVDWGWSYPSCTLFLDSISEHDIYLNIGDYYM